MNNEPCDTELDLKDAHGAVTGRLTLSYTNGTIMMGVVEAGMSEVPYVDMSYHSAKAMHDHIGQFLERCLDQSRKETAPTQAERDAANERKIMEWWSPIGQQSAFRILQNRFDGASKKYMMQAATPRLHAELTQDMQEALVSWQNEYGLRYWRCVFGFTLQIVNDTANVTLTDDLLALAQGTLEVKR